MRTFSILDIFGFEYKPGCNHVAIILSRATASNQKTKEELQKKKNQDEPKTDL